MADAQNACEATDTILHLSKPKKKRKIDFLDKKIAVTDNIEFKEVKNVTLDDILIFLSL